MTRKPINIQASIAARLRNIAAGAQTDLQLILRRYAIERLLYRLSMSAFRDRFVLKGAMLYTAWVPDPFRSTQDLDLLGFGDPGAPRSIAAFARSHSNPLRMTDWLSMRHPSPRRRSGAGRNMVACASS